MLESVISMNKAAILGLACVGLVVLGGAWGAVGVFLGAGWAVEEVELAMEKPDERLLLRVTVVKGVASSSMSLSASASETLLVLDLAPAGALVACALALAAGPSLVLE